MKPVHQSDLKIPFEEEAILRLPMAEMRKVDSLHNIGDNIDIEDKSNLGMGAACRIQVGSSGEGFWDLVRISKDIFLTIAEVRYNKTEEIIVQGEDLFKLRILVSGTIRWLDDVNLAEEEPRQMGPGIVVSYHPSGADTHYELSPDEHLSMVTLHCRRGLMREIFDESVYARVIGNHDDARSEQVTDQQLPLTPKIQLCINEILWSPYTAGTRLYFARAKCFELLCIVAGLLEEQEEPNPATVDQVVLSRKDVERLHLVRDKIREDLTVWCSSDELCRHIGLNSKKLKYGFKKIFGSTPYKYSIDIRMEQAFKKLKEDNLSVSEVAYSLGYNYPANFTTAFKKHYGFTPQMLRGHLEVS